MARGAAAAAAVIAFIIGILIGFGVGHSHTRTVTSVSTVTATKTVTSTKVSTVTMAPSTVTRTSTVTSREIVLIDALGRKVVLSHPASRVVTLAPSITEDVCALGFCSKIVGVDTFSKGVKGLPSNVTTVGGYWEPSTEKIVSLHPDLVLACSGVPAQERMASQLESLGVKVFFLRCDRSKTLSDIYWDLNAIATLLGNPAAAKKVEARMQAEINSIEKELANTTKPTVGLIVYLQKNGAWVAGGGTFQDTLITLAGGRNAFHRLYGWQLVGFEQIVAANPDYIIVTGMSQSSVNKTLAFIESTPLKSLKAFREGHVCVVYGQAVNRLNRPSVGIVQAVRLLAAIIHPGLVKPPASLAHDYTCIKPPAKGSQGS